MVAVLVAACLLGPMPLANAHAHNDYTHARPLLDALDAGFTSVEADIFLVDGKLLVGHSKGELKPDRTLEALYLGPLFSRFRLQGNIYRDEAWIGLPTPREDDRPEIFDARFPFDPAYGTTFQLLIDIKAEGSAVYKVLAPMLAKYRDMLTSFNPKVKLGTVTIVLSGDRPIDDVKKDVGRLCAIDGRPVDLDSSNPKDLVPLVSENWLTMFKWLGLRGMPEDQRLRLRDYVSKAHRQGRRVRFWGTPDKPEIWKELWAAGVDYLGTDDLPALRDFLLAQPRRKL